MKNNNVDKKKSESHSYNPSTSSYHPINDAFWKQGEKYVLHISLIIIYVLYQYIIL